MAKNKVGEDEKTYKNTEEEIYKNSEIDKKKKYIVVYKHNSSMEIYVGKEFLRFEANINNPVYPDKYKDGLPESIISHPDFIKQKKYFTVIEK